MNTAFLRVTDQPAVAANRPGGIGSEEQEICGELTATPGVRRYLEQMQWMFALMPEPDTTEGDCWYLDDGDRSTPLGKLAGFWKTRVMPDRWLAQNSAWLLDSSHPLNQFVGCGTGYERANPFADSIACVRLLGGWKSGWTTEVEKYDLVYRNEEGALQYRWQGLRDRLDGIVHNGLTPLIVLDNVPYCFVRRTVEAAFGQVMGPDDFAGWSEFVEALCHQLVELYGWETVNGWRFRIGTEPNMPGHWQDTQEKYLQTYDYATAAIKRVLPGSKVGPGNFNSPIAGNRLDLEQVLHHFASGTNYATGETGSPVDFLGISVYGLYRIPGFGDRHPYAEGYGYSPYLVKVAAQMLKNLRCCTERFGSIPIEFMEFGTLFNEAGDVSSEPGVFGAAWTAQAYMVALAEGVDRIYHWSAYELLGDNKFLVFGNGWLMAMMNRLVGGEARLLHCTMGTKVTPGTEVMSMRVDVGGHVYLVIALFNKNRVVNSRETVEVQVGHEQQRPVAIDEYRLDSTSSVYDRLYRDLAAANMLAAPINNLSKMATNEGGAAVRKNIDEYMEFQTQAFEPKPFSGDITQSEGELRLSLEASTPSVILLDLKVR